MMSRRFRSVSALAALLALSAFYVEGVWAALCPPAMDMEVAMSVEVAGGDEVGGPALRAASVEHAHAPSGTAGETGRADLAPATGVDGVPSDAAPAAPHDAPCPLAFAGAGSCTSVTVPAPADVRQLPAGPSVHQAVSSAPLNDHLSATSLFHPPRA